MKWLNTVHSVVIGPGLGRDEYVIQTTIEIIENNLQLKACFLAKNMI